MNNTFKAGVVCVALFATALTACSSARARKSSTLALHTDTGDSVTRSLNDQPDFMAEESERISQEHKIAELKGITTSYGVSKKGFTYRRDRAVVISYERPHEAALLFYPRSREYVESPRSGVWFENAPSPGLLASEEGANLLFESLGDEQLDGHKCLKVQVSLRKEVDKSSPPTKVVYYLATDLRNLVIRTDVIDVLGTTTYMLRNISFDVPKELFKIPTGYRKSAADPTAEYRLIDHFQVADLERIEPESFHNALLEKLPPGTSEEQIYRYLDERLIGKDRLSSYQRAEQNAQVVCRIEYDPTLPGTVKKHFAIVFLLDKEKNLRDVHLNSWISAP